MQDIPKYEQQIKAALKKLEEELKKKLGEDTKSGNKAEAAADRVSLVELQVTWGLRLCWRLVYCLVQCVFAVVAAL